MAAVKACKLTFQSKDETLWRKFLNAYERVFDAFCSKKSKKNLKDLDNWFQNTLGQDIRKQTPNHHLVKEDLIKLMEWKLTRGKFRPRLTQMITENKPEDIKKFSEEAFQNIEDPKKSIEKLCKLRAVGPATASALLTAYNPEKYAFMSDESVGMALSGKIDYTLKFYLKYLEQVQVKAKGLSSHETRWTAHQVELALWTSKVATQLNIDVCTDETSTIIPKGKRKSDIGNEQIDEEKENAKKQKLSSTRT